MNFTIFYIKLKAYMLKYTGVKLTHTHTHTNHTKFILEGKLKSDDKLQKALKLNSGMEMRGEMCMEARGGLGGFDFQNFSSIIQVL